MAKKSKRGKQKRLSKRTRLVILPAFYVFAAGAVALVILSIIMVPKLGSEKGYGIGADGFRAFTEEKGDLGVGSVATKEQVVAVLGKKAKSVGDPQVSKVFNMNGNRSQTLTFPFVRADGTASELYIDVRLYKNTQALEGDHLYVATANAGTVAGHKAYFKHAQTLDDQREYHMIVVNGLKVYRFVVSQPYGNVTISEVAALAAVKRLAAEAQL